jgi:hypothetical protein
MERHEGFELERPGAMEGVGSLDPGGGNQPESAYTFLAIAFLLPLLSYRFARAFFFAPHLVVTTG